MHDTLKLVGAYALAYLLPESPRVENFLQRCSGGRISRRRGERKLLEIYARSRRHAVYMGDSKLLCQILGKYYIWADARDYGVSPRLAMDGCWESWVTLAILRTVKPGMVCLDVGANHGYYSIVMADLVGPSGQVVAFEPNPVLADLIQASAYSNSLQERITVARSAVANTEGAKVLLSYRSGQAMNAGLSSHIPEGSVGFEATLLTLDSYCAKFQKVDFFKIDTEGAEELVWDGMQTVLQQNPQIIGVLEFNCNKYQNAAGFLEKIRNRFPLIRSIEGDGGLYEVHDKNLLDSVRKADWMLYLSAS